MTAAFSLAPYRWQALGKGWHLTAYDGAQVAVVYGPGVNPASIANRDLLAAAPVLYVVLKEIATYWAHGLAKPAGAEADAANYAEAERLGRVAAAALAFAEGNPDALALLCSSLAT